MRPYKDIKKWRGGPHDGKPVADVTGLGIAENDTVDSPTRVRVGSRWVSMSHMYMWQDSEWHYQYSCFNEWKKGMEDA
jgi:hypothetical protein